MQCPVCRVAECPDGWQTWPNRWSGDEPRADEPFVEDGQSALFDSIEEIA